MRGEPQMSSNAILRAIASKKKVDELPIELREQKRVKKGLFIPATDTVHRFCTKRNKYIRDDPASAFSSVRQWGIKVTKRSHPPKFSAKGKVYVDGRTIAWHEARGVLHTPPLVGPMLIDSPHSGIGAEIEQPPPPLPASAQNEPVVPIPAVPADHASKSISFENLSHKAPTKEFSLLMGDSDMKLYHECNLDGKLKMIRERLPVHLDRCMISALIMTTEGARVRLLKNKEVSAVSLRRRSILS